MSLNLRISIVLCMVSGIVSGCAQESESPPQVARNPVEMVRHGDIRVDDYYWLRERDNPDVIAYLEAENRYTDAVLAETAGLQDRLFAEMKSRIREDESSAPYRHDDYFYYTRFEAGQEYPVYCRRLGSMDAEEEILLDVNREAEGESFFAVRGFRVSPDHKLAAYGVDTVGRRFYDLVVIDLETGEKLADRIPSVTPNFRWAEDSESLFYTRQHPDTLRWYQVYRHKLGDHEDDLVYQEDDITFSTYVYRSLSEEFIYIANQSTLSTEVRYLSADNPESEPRILLPREPEHEYIATDGGDRFYILSNKDAENFQLLEASLDDTAVNSWQVVIPHRDDVLIEDFDVFDGHLVLTVKDGGLTQIEVLDRETGDMHRIDFGEAAYSAYTGNNWQFDADSVRYYYESPTTPDSVYDYDLNTRERTLVKEKEIPGGFDRNDYTTERFFVTVRDGAKVPITVVYKKGMELNGQNPLMQYGYGSYGANVEPGFSANLLSLLDRGFVYVTAHIRGSSTMGRDWYYEGRQFNKINTFNDFIDVSKFLIQEGYTSPDHLYAYGGSAGGLLMGAVVNMAPELYNGVISAVPFVDVVTTMLDEDIPLTSGEWDEWGDPREKEFYDYMLSYSPYDQVSRQDYPNILVTTGLHDSQVQYWEPAKWVAKLREYKTDDNVLILETDMEAGHGGKTGRFRSLEELALYYSFFLYLEGISE